MPEIAVDAPDLSLGADAESTDAALIVSVLQSAADALRHGSGAVAALVCVFAGNQPAMNVPSGPVVLRAALPGDALWRACGRGGNNRVSLTDGARIAELCGPLLRIGRDLPRRLDLQRVSDADGDCRGVLCLLDAADGSARASGDAGLLPGIAAMVRAALQLRDELERYRHRTLFGPHLICMVDPAGRVTEIGKPLRSLLGVDAPDGIALHRQLLDRLHPDDLADLSAEWSLAKADGRPMEVEHRLLMRDGSFRWFRSRARPLRDATGGIARWCAVLEDVHERRSDRLRLAHLASHDAVTGLFNRGFFRDEVERRLASGRSDFAVARLELLDFRAVTDTFGHEIGDRLLCGAAGRIEQALRHGDMLAHGGSNEFYVLLRDVRNVADAQPLTNAILAALKDSLELDDAAVSMGAAIGVCFAGELRTDADLLMQNADLALLRALRAGRGCCRFYAPETDERVRRLQALKVELAYALERAQFHLVYQPIIHCASGRVRGMEALLRWSHPVLGLVSPAEFIPELEASGLLIPVGEWVINRACHDAVEWTQPLSVSVNLSTVQFRQPELIDSVRAALLSSGLDPRRLIMEITESVPLLGENENLAMLEGLRALGIPIALDDFGSGYASLSYLQHFRFDFIKIERSFVAHMLDGEKTKTILRAVIRLAQSLGSVCVAEGVETREQFEFLCDRGCDAVQGYLFHPPVRNEAVPSMLDGLEKRRSTEFPASAALASSPSCPF